MKNPSKIVLKKDIVIPAGTVFECCDGRRSEFISGNYETTIGLSKDTSGTLVYGFEPKDKQCAKWFKAE